MADRTAATLFALAYLQTYSNYISKPKSKFTFTIYKGVFRIAVIFWSNFVGSRILRNYKWTVENALIRGHLNNTWHSRGGGGGHQSVTWTFLLYKNLGLNTFGTEKLWQRARLGFKGHILSLLFHISKPISMKKQLFYKMKLLQGSEKRQKKCHVLFEWPLNSKCKRALKSLKLK